MSCLTASSTSSFLTLFKFISSSNPSWEKDVENIEEVFEDVIDENIVKTDDVEDDAEYGNEKIDVVVENANCNFVPNLMQYIETSLII